jgi:pyruvate dehydrogenase E2 component (dihydrolipoamide acetyltransferase)
VTAAAAGVVAAPVSAAVKIDEVAFSTAHASPSVRKFARELGADLGKVRGTGVKGRITQEDVKAHVKGLLTAAKAPAPAAAPVAALPKVPVVDFALFGPVELKPLSRIQKISGARLQASWLNLPHVTQQEDADITDLEAARGALKGKAEQEGVRLTPLVFIIKASLLALQEFPRFNASLDAGGENLVLKKYFNIGFAADTPNGLMVPVIANADRLSIYEIARTLAEMSERARAGKLKAAEMQGGSFTISSLGGIGGTYFTPIINAPEVAILGVSRSSQKPVYERGAFIPRLMLPLSLSYDHRVIDGAEAARFTVFLAKKLGDVKALL